MHIKSCNNIGLGYNKYNEIEKIIFNGWMMYGKKCAEF